MTMTHLHTELRDLCMDYVDMVVRHPGPDKREPRRAACDDVFSRRCDFLLERGYDDLACDFVKQTANFCLKIYRRSVATGIPSVMVDLLVGDGDPRVDEFPCWNVRGLSGTDQTDTFPADLADIACSILGDGRSKRSGVLGSAVYM
jgi:hypothetical protein